ncbi:M23 family metallopeptidase [Candidatus Nomurabacteria bacterium]|uniref:M23 family metallopeptidase n=1 Tax=candidate division WWE3 bacterium TaxID=2053526 RepID=A0A955E1S4_UNCKA|nr:M23 family metallopeptidase [candidate division WWE3 bacterium]MCB9824001.1 M23 family metallopeptidase [Candidatus Nomurabacteria bacterium]MCB9827028.1 M23 family metallopeptidase [Candidatus Nomurabacteria bacterium]MCB9827942.1 M23 family metallopeptidase [Candidatus Nomurabacteria bacterium]HXK52820.1 M23 family metallopeptidase [bacterium]
MNLKYPVDHTKYIIFQEFGNDNTNNQTRKEFYTVFDNKHPGVDFLTPVGVTVRASFEGIVVRKEFHKGMGNVIGIRNGNIVALYAHLKDFSVELGDIVKQKQDVGHSGETGSACILPHLHFELRDISKNSLKEMVFKPEFLSEVSLYSEHFYYTVNNTNTQKTLAKLSVLYFGTTKYWMNIAQFNKLSQSQDEDLQNGKKLLIPNY